MRPGFRSFLRISACRCPAAALRWLRDHLRLLILPLEIGPSLYDPIEMACVQCRTEFSYISHLRPLTVWIMALRHPRIANRIAKSWKTVPSIPKPSGKKISNLMKYPVSAGITWQRNTPISTLQSDPENFISSTKASGPLLGPKAVSRALFGAPGAIFRTTSKIPVCWSF